MTRAMIAVCLWSSYEIISNQVKWLDAVFFLIIRIAVLIFFIIINLRDND